MQENTQESSMETTTATEMQVSPCNDTKQSGTSTTRQLERQEESRTTKSVSPARTSHAEMHYDSSHEDSTPLHIHDCDVKDDVELTAIVYADEIPTGLSDETVIASAPRVPTQEQVAEKYHRPDRYVKHDDLLEWDPKNTIPDVFAMTEQHTMHAKIWIPIFTGKNFKNFIDKFEDLREVFTWGELTSRAYLLRSIRKLDSAVIEHIAQWTYGAMVVYLAEKYTPTEQRLAAIDKVMEIERGNLESIRSLATRISKTLVDAPLARDKRQALAGAAFRYALRYQPSLVEHLERSLYIAPQFFQQVDVAALYDSRHGPETVASVVTDGGNELATLQVRGTPLPASLHTPKQEELSDSDTPGDIVHVHPITSRGARKPHPKTRKAAKEVLQLQTPVVYVDRIYPRWGGTMHVVLEFALLQEPVYMLVDTGAAVSILPEPYFKRLAEPHRVLQPNHLDIRASNNTPIVCQGRVQLQFTIRHYHRSFTHDFYVCNESTTPLLGMDFMSEYNTLVHLRVDKFAIDGVICSTYDESRRLVRQGMTTTASS